MVPAVKRCIVLLYPLFAFTLTTHAQDTLNLESARFCMPLQSLHVTSSFGWRVHPLTGNLDFHWGIDLSARSEPVYCILDGLVIASGSNTVLGNYIRVEHSGAESIYGHLSLVCVQTGQGVTAGQIIGVTGSTGRSTGEHLHFSIKINGGYVHPLNFLTALADGRSLSQSEYLHGNNLFRKRPAF